LVVNTSERSDVTVQFSLKMFSLYRENAFQHTFF
jgi:hypothetical protein